MAQRYFELIDEMSSPDRWLLGDPVDEQGNEVRTRQFMSGESTRFDGRLRVPIYHPGASLDFSRADTSGIPVVSQKVAALLLTLAPGDIQLIPVEKVGDAKVFRLWGYKGSLIVSEDIKEALERTGATGTEFREVTGPWRSRDEQ